ncbi:triokinase/FMN cyclase-like [Pomacea canaliculata]|nr:triokinase/FMN cyclase-like [Pomacea canaliculata]
MLSAAVAGSVFTSPPPASILAAIRAIGQGNPGGVLVVVKNYTGDRLNFGLSVERAKAEGIKVDMVIIGEDCALASIDKTAGRRGLCGTVLIHKIAGALAEKGYSLDKISNIVRNVTTKMGTMGLSLTPCSVPGSGPSFHLGTDEMELGLGIHGEAGVKRMKLLSAKEAIKEVLDHLTNPQTETHLLLEKGDSVAVMINNLGGTSVLELNIVAKEVIAYLEAKGVLVDRAYCGTYMTSLEMAGISITVLRLDTTLKDCLDSLTNAPAWKQPLLTPNQKDRRTPDVMKVKTSSAANVMSSAHIENFISLPQETADLVYDIVQNVSEALLAAEQHLNSLDTQAGDGDCGSTLARGARAILDQLGPKEKPSLPVGCPALLAAALANIAENVMGGSSGALYSLFLTAASSPLQTGTEAKDWCVALQTGIQAMMKYGGAEPGQRTMLDPLHAAATNFSAQLTQTNGISAFASAAQAAETAAQNTAQMKAQAGRASYVNSDILNQPDAGAVAVTIWMKAIAAKLL